MIVLFFRIRLYESFLIKWPEDDDFTNWRSVFIKFKFTPIRWRQNLVDDGVWGAVKFEDETMCGDHLVEMPLGEPLVRC